MTVQREEPGVLIAICDGCGERRVLDLDEETERVEIIEQLKLLGWRNDVPDRHRFPAHLSSYTEIYERDLCADCQSDEPKPKPLMRHVRRSPSGPHDVMINDPCDEWPRGAIWASLGLRPACGHPMGPVQCPYCEEGYPIGDTRQWFKR